MNPRRRRIARQRRVARHAEHRFRCWRGAQQYPTFTFRLGPEFEKAMAEAAEVGKRLLARIAAQAKRVEPATCIECGTEPAHVHSPKYCRRCDEKRANGWKYRTEIDHDKLRQYFAEADVAVIVEKCRAE